jgi:glycosyltransferase involved in cell wall biosynthesis
MRVLNVVSFLDPVIGGGNVERTLQLTRAFVGRGISCQIVTTRSDNFTFPDFRFEGLKIHYFPLLFKRFNIPLASLTTLRTMVKEADIIHLIGHWSALNALIFFAAKLENKPYVVCPAGALRIYGRSKLLKFLYNWIIGRRIIKNAAGWIAVTPDERSQFQSYGIPEYQINIIPNAINPKDFLVSNLEEFRMKYRLGSNPFILFMGRLNYIKGPDLLLEAFCRNSKMWAQYHLVFAGSDGGLLANLKRMVSEFGECNRIHFLGHIDGHDKSAAYKCAEILVIPSRHEAMSIVVLEAGICGTPVLLTDQCGFDNVQRVGGGVVIPASILGIEEGLSRLLIKTNNLTAMGKRLRNYVEADFTWTEVVNKYIEYYKRIITAR